MAILDRPMFQRPLTKDQLRAYGIPAFANGGIVVQKFANGREVTKPINVKEKFQEAAEGYFDPQAREKAIQEGRFFSPVSGLEDKIANLEKKITLMKNNNQDTTAEEAELAQLKSQLAEEKVKKEEATADSTPVPKDLTDALKTGDTEKVKETLLTQEGPGQDEIIEEKTTSVTDTLGAPEKERLSNLESLVRERSDLYKKILGDPREGLKQQGLLQLAQFGLNLASAKGGNFAEKIANSAKDPLQAFAALGREAMKDERAIEMLAIKGAEDELGRTQKPGTFGQLVNDILANNKNMTREQATQKAFDITTAKSGKTPQEIRREAYNMYYDDFIERGEEVSDAQRLATEAVNADFGVTSTGEGEEVKVVDRFKDKDGKEVIQYSDNTFKYEDGTPYIGE